MGFGFRGQSDNPAIIQAAIIHNDKKSLNSGLKAEVKQILVNEIKARNRVCHACRQRFKDYSPVAGDCCYIPG